MAPLRIDPVAEARRHWEERWGAEPSRPMAAVTSIMRAQQVLMARLNDLVRPHGLTFPRYEALVLLSYTRPRRAADRQARRAPPGPPHVGVVDRRGAGGGRVRRPGRPSERDGRATLAVITGRAGPPPAPATEDLNNAAFGLSALTPEEQESLDGHAPYAAPRRGRFRGVAWGPHEI